MVVRPHRPSDLNTLYKIDQECFPPEIAYTRGDLERFVRHRNSKTWVAEENGQVAGFLVAGREPPKVAHLITIDVLHKWRRRGIGSALLKVAEAWARSVGIEVIYLETAVNNQAAQRLYEAREYRRVECLDDYYGRGAPAWVMMKRLA
jgi:ribosomal-protein-alanine N-acetyltransferase